MEEFILPEVSCVKATTKEQDIVLTDYIRENFNDKADYDPTDEINTWFLNKPYHGYFYMFTQPSNIYTHITYDQFIKYVVNEEISKKQYEYDSDLEIIYINLLNL